MTFEDAVYLAPSLVLFGAVIVIVLRRALRSVRGSSW